MKCVYLNAKIVQYHYQQPIVGPVTIAGHMSLIMSKVLPHYTTRARQIGIGLLTSLPSLCSVVDFCSFHS